MGDHDGQAVSAAEFLDSVRDVAYAVDDDLELVNVNERFAAAAGMPREALLGRSVAELAATLARDEDAVDEYVATMRTILDDERGSARVEFPAHTEPLGDHYVEARLSPIERDGAVVGVAGVARDVTRRHSYERQLEVKSEELAVLNRVLRHDVRNDMAVVEGWLGELVDRLAGEDRAVAERARDAARHTIQLTDMARDYAAVVAEGAEPEVEPTDLRALLTAELERHRALYPHATYAVEGDLPQVDVRATPMLQSVFTNLLHNAVQHSDRDHPTVTLSVEVGADTATVRVADDGPGLPSYVDDPFPREASSLDDDGASLGLYLVQRLVSAYGGAVDYEANDPRGAVFVVELPLADALGP